VEVGCTDHPPPNPQPLVVWREPAEEVALLGVAVVAQLVLGLAEGHEEQPPRSRKYTCKDHIPHRLRPWYPMVQEVEQSVVYPYSSC
jgi:hypothetical protein